MIRGALIFVLFLFSCKPDCILLDELTLKGDRFYISETDLFTGMACDMFEGDDKQTAFKVEFNSGIPDGDWNSYGFSGEVIQSGTYEPIYLGNDSFLKKLGVKRLNIWLGKEGNYSFRTLFIVGDGKKIDSSYVVKNVLNTAELSQFNFDEVEFVKSELQR